MITFKNKKEEEFWKLNVLAKNKDVTENSSLGLYVVRISTNFADDMVLKLRERQSKKGK